MNKLVNNYLASIGTGPASSLPDLNQSFSLIAYRMEKINRGNDDVTTSTKHFCPVP